MSDHAPFRTVYKVVDGCEIDTDIYLPHSTNDTKKYPVVIDLHGGAFILGSSDMVNKDQIQDCLSRGWIVSVPNFRLCPQVNILEGPMQDCRDLLRWIHHGELDRVLRDSGKASYQCDHDRIIAFGTSSGGHLALGLGFGVERPVAAIFNLYGACNFSAPFWTSKLPQIAAKLPPNLSPDFINQVYIVNPVPIRGGVSLEGQAPGPPNFNDPRQAFAFSHIADGTLLDVCFPSKAWEAIDPIRNLGPSFPPTFIVHGQRDSMIPIDISRGLYTALQRHGIHAEMREVPDEEHTFAAKMKVGSRTWNLQREGFDFMQTMIE